MDSTNMYIAILLMILCVVFLWCRFRNSNEKRCIIPCNWPVVGMIPGLLVNLHRIHDYGADVLEASGGTFMFKGPWLTNVDMLITCDPTNVHYILSKNFPNFGRGPQFKKMFADLGEGIFNAEGEFWGIQRKTTHAVFHHPSFKKFLVMATRDKVEKGMIAVLDHVSKLGIDVELQELIQRFAFDITCVLLLDYDPASLSIEFPDFPFNRAFAEAEEAIFFRHILPEAIWKFQQWLQIGKEKKLSKAVRLIDEFLADRIASNQEKLKIMDNILNSQEGSFDFMTGYMKTLEDVNGAPDIVSNKIWRDTMFNFIFAGKDTIGAALTWFFWLVATNPDQEIKIREEIITNLHINEEGVFNISQVEELNSLVYLHGALCETLRLFPPVPLQHKAPIEADILPSGHCLKPNTKTVIPFCSMGRMELIWGEDCLEFKPERWISERGGIKNVPSFKFTAFNAGPRSCLGKEMSFIQMKIVAAAVIYNFQFKVVDGQSILPSTSVVLHMKHGLKVRVSRRD